MVEHSPNLKRLVPLYIACYLFWIGFIAVTIWTLLQWRNALYVLLPIVGPWVFMAIDKFGVLLMGVFALGWLIYVEHYLREGISRELFWRRVVRLAVIHAIALGGAYGVMLLNWFIQTV